MFRIRCLVLLSKIDSDGWPVFAVYCALSVDGLRRLKWWLGIIAFSLDLFYASLVYRYVSNIYV